MWISLARPGRALIATFGGTALGDIALVPAPFLKDPRGIRDVGEWYMSLKSRRDYVHGIKQEYGDRLTFWGGGVDTQKTLPFGTLAEVGEQVLRRCEIFARDGFCLQRDS